MLTKHIYKIFNKRIRSACYFQKNVHQEINIFQKDVEANTVQEKKIKYTF